MKTCLYTLSLMVLFFSALSVFLYEGRTFKDEYDDAYLVNENRIEQQKNVSSRDFETDSLFYSGQIAADAKDYRENHFTEPLLIWFLINVFCFVLLMPVQMTLEEIEWGEVFGSLWFWTIINFDVAVLLIIVSQKFYYAI